MLSKIKGIAFEGGGMSGVAYMGALQKWIESGFTLEQFTVFAGSSVGSISAAFLSLRAKIEYVSDKMQKTNFKTFLDERWTRFGGFFGVCEYYGYYKGDALKKWLTECVEKITGNPNITMLEAHEKYNTHLLITKVDVLYPMCKLVVMSYTTHPTTTIVEAIHTSCAIPYVYPAISGSGTEIGHIFVDGGTLLNYPIHTLYSILDPKEVIGLCLTHKDPQDDYDEYRPVRSNKEFIESIAKSWLHMAFKRHIGHEDWERTCNIPVSLKTLDFDASIEKLEEAYKDGSNAMEKFIKKYKYSTTYIF